MVLGYTQFILYFVFTRKKCRLDLLLFCKNLKKGEKKIMVAYLLLSLYNNVCCWNFIFSLTQEEKPSFSSYLARIKHLSKIKTNLILNEYWTVLIVLFLLFDISEVKCHWLAIFGWFSVICTDKFCDSCITGKFCSFVVDFKNFRFN